MRERPPEEENFSSDGTAKYTEPGIIPTNLYPSKYRDKPGLFQKVRGSGFPGSAFPFAPLELRSSAAVALLLIT